MKHVIVNMAVKQRCSHNKSVLWPHVNVQKDTSANNTLHLKKQSAFIYNINKQLLALAQ